MASTNIYHWIGATADSVNKYDWNVTNNWLVENTTSNDSTTSVNYTKYTRATRSPISGDTVMIGQLFHCFSPILFGGYAGGMTHSATNFWDSGLSAVAAGITNGGVDLCVYTDVPAATSPASFNKLYSLLKNADGTYYYGATAGGPWGSTGSFSQNMSDFNLTQALLSVNPHFPMGTYSRIPGATGAISYVTNATAGAAYGPNDMAFYGSYDAACLTDNCQHTVGEYGMTPAKYPFPYLGGGLTGDILTWATTQYARSWYGYDSAGAGGGLTTAALRSETLNNAARRNAWIGGGISGLTAGGVTGATVARATQNSLRVRHGDLKFLSSDTALNNPLFVDMDLVHDFSANFSGMTGVVSSNVVVDQNLCTNHAFRLEGGIVKELNLMGDASVWAVGTTAASINSDVSTYLRTDATLRCGGIRIRWTIDSDRFNTYSGYFLGGITAGARAAVYGALDDTSVRDTNANKLILEPVGDLPKQSSTLPTQDTMVASAYGSSTMSAQPQEMAAFSTALLDPIFSIGLIGGITSAAVVIPTLESSSEYEKQWQIHMSGPVSINTISDKGSNIVLASPLAAVTNRVVIGNLYAEKGTIVDFRSNPGIDDILLGTLAGTGAGQTNCNISQIRFAGGLQCKDDSVTILASAGQTMLNNKIVSGKDIRATIVTGNFSPVLNASRNSAVKELLNITDALPLNPNNQ